MRIHPVTVESDETYTLQPGEQNLILTGNSHIDGIGNELDNEITGNRRRNRLEGLDGNDTLDGGDSRDTLMGGDGDDNLSGGDHRDILMAVRVMITSRGATVKIHLSLPPMNRLTGILGWIPLLIFDPDDDSIELSQTTFTALESEIDDEFSIPAEFAIVEDITAAEVSEALIVYNQSHRGIILQRK
jgi:hypothetical protein